MPEIDFNTRNSNLDIGLEVEWPELDPHQDEMYVDRGNSSSSLQTAVDRLPMGVEGRPVYDGTVGLEIVSEPMSLADAENWYREVIEGVSVEYNTDYQPVGLMKGGSTAGMHVHLSDLSESQAETLADMSREPWMQVLFCSSIAADDNGVTWPVFRGGRYCDLHYSPTGDHYAVVNRRSPGHYEWRLPEPVVPEHIDILTEFLRAFEQSEDAAVEYAQELLDDGDDRITAIRRAEAVGMDIEDMPEVRNAPSEDDPENFYEQVATDWSLPEIYTIHYNGNDFYFLESQMVGEIEVADTTVEANDLLFADELSPVDDPELQNEVERAYMRYTSQTEHRETQATETLKDIIKKKKGKK